MTRFVRQPRRDSHRQRVASLSVGIALTALLLMVTTISAPMVYELFGGQVASRRVLSVEQIGFVVADHARAHAGTTLATRSGTGRPRRPATGTATPIAAPFTRQIDAAPASSDPADPVTPLLPHPALRGPQRVTAPSFGTFPSRVSELSRTQKDSLLFVFELGIPRARTLPPTPETRDSLERERARIFAAARDAGRPVAVPLMGGGFRLPLFSPGPSREQRRRDSIIHAGNLLRIEGLALRARVRQDSLRRMDSIAMLNVP